ncbi:MAG: carbon storage regulator [Planctomycetota bacterium]|nr:carbon storage regulator [Planctomycetota bacterium]
MLVLSRKIGEEIVIADQVRVRILAIHGQRIRLGIMAPESVQVHRAEIHQQRLEFELTQPMTIELLPNSA